MFALVVSAAAALHASIWMSQVSGSCADAHGRPLAGATIVFHDVAHGRHFSVTTNNRGEFFYIAVEPATYDIELRKDGRSLLRLQQVPIAWSKLAAWIEFDLKTGTARVTQRRPMNEAVVSTSDLPPKLVPAGEADAALVAAINEKLAKAAALGHEGDWDAAIAELKDAVDLDPSRDVPHARLADAYWHASLAAGSHAEVDLRHASEEYTRAIELRPVAAYHNNLGQVYARQQRWDDAIAAFKAAAALDAEQRPLYDLNAGVVLFDRSQSEPAGEVAHLRAAVALFAEVLKAEPQNAEAHYLNAVGLLRQASAEPEWKTPDAAVASLQRYLELAPDGRHADEVRALLASLHQPKK